MTTVIELSVRIVEWDDPAFVRAVEAAREEVHREGLAINGPRAAARAEVLLRGAGYPDTRVECARTVEEAMAHHAHWTVHRDPTS